MFNDKYYSRIAQKCPRSCQKNHPLTDYCNSSEIVPDFVPKKCHQNCPRDFFQNCPRNCPQIVHETVTKGLKGLIHLSWCCGILMGQKLQTSWILLRIFPMVSNSPFYFLKMWRNPTISRRNWKLLRFSHLFVWRTYFETFRNNLCIYRNICAQIHATLKWITLVKHRYASESVLIDFFTFSAPLFHVKSKSSYLNFTKLESLKKTYYSQTWQ